MFNDKTTNNNNNIDSEIITLTNSSLRLRSNLLLILERKLSVIAFENFVKVLMQSRTTLLILSRYKLSIFSKFRFYTTYIFEAINVKLLNLPHIQNKRKRDSCHTIFNERIVKTERKKKKNICIKTRIMLSFYVTIFLEARMCVKIERKWRYI